MVDYRKRQLLHISQIARLAESELVVMTDDTGRVPRGFWGFSGDQGAITKHSLGQAICDGNLTAEEIAPFLPDLQKVAAKLRRFDKVDQRFEICAQFIEEGDLSKLELVRDCY